jgi:Asp-tRNA(Asn)/Glu-tRNA(Gln) amidotransferase A subunit family amidase
VPGAVGVNGRPMGVQLIAPRGRDDVCLEAGLCLEQALRG